MSTSGQFTAKIGPGGNFRDNGVGASRPPHGDPCSYIASADLGQ